MLAGFGAPKIFAAVDCLESSTEAGFASLPNNEVYDFSSGFGIEISGCFA